VPGQDTILGGGSVVYVWMQYGYGGNS
jgi:hypothetical protein